MFTRMLTAAATAALLAAPTLAADSLTIEDPYARAASPSARAGAAFMVIVNPTATDDRLIAAATDAARRVELHTHIEEDGVMRMTEVEGGIPVPAGAQTRLMRGGLHVMMMGLTRSLEQGDTIDLTLTFEGAGDIELSVPVDNERMDMGGHGMGGHGGGMNGQGMSSQTN